MVRNIRGESKLGCLVLLLITASAAYIGFKWGEAQWNYESMKGKIIDSVKLLASQKNVQLNLIKKSIVDSADDLGLDIYTEDIEISQDSSYITIDVYWDVPIELPGYTYYLEYSVSNTRRKGY